LVRALDSDDQVQRYNALRLLNRANDTHFDPDIAVEYLAGKYALSFLDPSDDQAKNLVRMQAYWKSRSASNKPATKAN
jgi:hypothetical protein